jgi:dihydrofolate reductase
MLLSMIVAVGEGGEIGRDGVLPWPKLARDMQWFRDKTMGKPVIMGRKTWDSIPADMRPLKGRANIILSRTHRFMDGYGDAYTVPDVDAALTMAEFEGGNEAVVIGGAEIFNQFIDRADRIYLTRVGIAVPDADTFFPYPLSKLEWTDTPAYNRTFLDSKSQLWMDFHTFNRIRV